MKAIFFLALLIITSISCSDKELPDFCPDEPICFLSIFPNPTESDATLTFKSDKQFQDTVKIYHLNGQLGWFGLVEVEIGLYEEKLLLTELKSGIYLIELGHLSEEYSTRLFKN